MKVSKNSKSKRTTLKTKYKIEKKTREHNRKLRKKAKLNQNKKRKETASMASSIPNAWPFKEELLQEIENKRAEALAQKEAEKERRAKERQKILQKRKREENRLSSMQTEARLLADVARRQRAYELKHKDDQVEEDKKLGELKDTTKKSFMRDLKKVVEAADIILEVLDARDPVGTRCPSVESLIMSSSVKKRIVLVLNKIDLVPREVVTKWLTHLRGQFPTVLFKANTQNQAKHLGQSKVNLATASDSIMKSAETLGADALIQLLKNYQRNNGLKTSVSVGVVGYPNVGKSSLINSLKRTRAVTTGAMPGVTKNLQEVQLDKKVKLIDCPGIVFAKDDVDQNIILRNAVKVDQLNDPIEPVNTIVARCKREQLMETYKIPAFRDCAEFLFMVAKKKGKLGKGGVPDAKAAARSVLQDWNSGKIQFYTEPPQVAPDAHVSSAIVEGWGKEFDVGALESNDASVIETLPSMKAVGDSYMKMATGTASKADLDFDEEEDMDEGSGEESDDDDEEEEEEEEMAVEEAPSKKRKAEPVSKKGKSQAQRLASEEDDVNPQTTQAKKKQLKKAKRDQRRGRLNDSYDFNEDFDDEDEEVPDAIPIEGEGGESDSDDELSD